jgi:hypothetical protein
MYRKTCPNCAIVIGVFADVLVDVFVDLFAGSAGPEGPAEPEQPDSRKAADKHVTDKHAVASFSFNFALLQNINGQDTL